MGVSAADGGLLALHLIPDAEEPVHLLLEFRLSGHDSQLGKRLLEESDRRSAALVQPSAAPPDRIPGEYSKPLHHSPGYWRNATFANNDA